MLLTNLLAVLPRADRRIFSQQGHQVVNTLGRRHQYSACFERLSYFHMLGEGYRSTRLYVQDHHWDRILDPGRNRRSLLRHYPYVAASE